MVTCGDCAYWKSAKVTVHKEWKECINKCVMKAKTIACIKFKFPTKLKIRRE